MSKPAVMKGTYADIRFMSGHKVARVSIDIPIEYSNEFLAMFGAPDRANPVWCAVARLAEPNAGEESGDVGKSETPKGVVGTQMPRAGSIPASRSLTRSQIAALKLNDEGFQIWLADKYPATWDDFYINRGMLSPEAADAVLKDRIGISSKKELDSDPVAADRFDRLLTDYDNRNHLRG